MIVSHHSGTILADKDPVVPLEKDLSEAAKLIFNKLISAGKNGLQRENLAEVGNNVCKDSFKYALT